jgi:hypothetical protein
MRTSTLIAVRKTVAKAYVLAPSRREVNRYDQFLCIIRAPSGMDVLIKASISLRSTSLMESIVS